MTLALLVCAAAYVALHVLAPETPLFSWSYAHFGDHGATVPIVLALASIPLLTAWLWPRRPGPAAPVSRRQAATAVLGLWLAFSLVGNAYPVAPICPDTWYFRSAVSLGVVHGRWMLTLRGFGALWPWFTDLPLSVFIRTGNALLTAIAFVAMSGAARHLARDHREWIAMTLLTWTAFGNLQLAIGYIDVYPAAQMFLALYVYAAVRALDGSAGAVWPFAIAAVAPFFYIGLSLLAPSALVLAWLVARRDGVLRLVVPAAISVLLAGACTIPVYGYPFAFGRMIADTPMNAAAGLSPDSTLLPAWYLFSADHVRDVASGLLLVDGMGLLLGLLFAAWIVRLPVAWFLAAVTAPMLVHFATMDPLFGPYADWDLFSYVAVPTSIVGAFAFLSWLRGQQRWAGALVGLVLAANVSHLVAKLNRLDVGFDEHIRESPWHSDGRLFVPPGDGGRNLENAAEWAAEFNAARKAPGAGAAP